MSHAAHETYPAPLDKVRLPAAPKLVAALFALGGAAAFGGALAAGRPDLAWGGYLMGSFLTLGLGLFGTVWLCMMYLGRGTWSVTTRRIAEAMTAWLLPGGALAVLTGLGLHDLYHWSHSEVVAGDWLLSHKAPFLNAPMFWGFTAGSVLVWVALNGLLLRNSRRQDETGAARHTRRNTVLAAPLAVVFALSFSGVSFLHLMSLDAHWFSTMFAILTFTDLMQTGLAVATLIAAVFLARGTLGGFLNASHVHSLGKLTFAFTGFWAYVYFCQFLLIWYGNLPEETAYYLLRWNDGWAPYLVALPFVKFVVPFIVLLPREAKRRPRVLIPTTVLIILAQILELYVMVAPALGHGPERAHAHLPLIETAITLGFLGLFFLTFAWSFARHAPVPLKDPWIREALHFHE